MTYDDADNTTICPHEPLRSPEIKEQWLLGKSLLGKTIRFRHMPPGSGHRCTSLYFDGMVAIEGLPGEFAPHLFIEDEGEMPGEHATKIPLEGTVN
jgi:hypothetical protein